MASSHGGAKVGTKVAHLVSKSIVATHGKLLHIKHKLAMMIFHSISDMISGEVHQSLDSTLIKLWEQLPEDSPAKPLVGFMANETGQLQAGAGISMVAGSLLSSLGLIINNELNPSVRGILQSNPHMLPDPQTLAILAAKGLASNTDAIDSITQNGINAGWASALIKAAKTYPTPTDAMDMLRRKLIDVSTFQQYCQLNGIDLETSAHYADLMYVPLSPADAALAVLRGNIPMGQAQEIAAEWGLQEKDFQVLIDNTGEPLGLMQLLEAFRRGFIDEERLKQGILDSRVRNDWIDTAIKLRYNPMTVSDAVNAVVQNQMAESDAEAIADQNGLEPGAFAILRNTAGEPLSRTEMEDLYNRGLVTKSQVEQALSESRLKNKYNSYAFELHERLLDVGHISEAVLYGTMTHQQAIDQAMLHGYSADSAAIIAQSAVNRKLETERRQVMTAIVALYEANGISIDDAKSAASSLGFEPDEMTFILEAAEFRRNEKLVAAALTAVRSKYIGHHITESQAQAYIDALNLPTAQRDQVLQLWTIEREANVLTLTVAQIVKAFNGQLITEADAMQRLANKGLNQTDAALLLEGA